MDNSIKNNIYLSLILIIAISTLSGCSNQTKRSGTGLSDPGVETPVLSSSNASVSNEYPTSSAEQVADRLQIYYFHRTQRCSTCLSIGRYTGELINQKFSDQLKQGVIEFREVNVDLPENKELAFKFKASGPSLFINSINGNQENINEDFNIWRLTRNEAQFKTYLENKINSLLSS